MCGRARRRARRRRLWAIMMVQPDAFSSIIWSSAACTTSSDLESRALCLRTGALGVSSGAGHVLRG